MVNFRFSVNLFRTGSVPIQLIVQQVWKRGAQGYEAVGLNVVDHSIHLSEGLSALP